jgi:hypothetical protein
MLQFSLLPPVMRRVPEHQAIAILGSGLVAKQVVVLYRNPFTIV